MGSDMDPVILQGALHRNVVGVFSIGEALAAERHMRAASELEAEIGPPVPVETLPESLLPMRDVWAAVELRESAAAHETQHLTSMIRYIEAAFAAGQAAASGEGPASFTDWDVTEEARMLYEATGEPAAESAEARSLEAP
jgi:hypothetical protein